VKHLPSQKANAERLPDSFSLSSLRVPIFLFLLLTMFLKQRDNFVCL